MYIIAASLLGNFALNIYSYLRGPEPPFSQYTFANDAMVVEEVLPNSAADRAGIQALDRVLAIDGRRVPGLGQWDALPGAVLGTLRYMSPEQRRGLDPHPSWDLWALAVVAYEILTGAYPFNDGSRGDWFGPGPAAGFTPIAINLSEAPPSWQEFFNRAFAHEITQRPQSAETFFSEYQRATS